MPAPHPWKFLVNIVQGGSRSQRDCEQGGSLLAVRTAWLESCLRQLSLRHTPKATPQANHNRVHK